VGAPFWAAAGGCGWYCANARRPVPNAKQTAAMVAAPAIALAPKRTAHGFAKAPSFAKASGGEPIGRTETGWVDAIFSIELVGLTLRSSEVYHSPVVKYS